MSAVAIQTALLFSPFFVAGVIALFWARGRRIRKEKAYFELQAAAEPIGEPAIMEMRRVNLLLATTRYGFPAFLSFLVPGLGQMVKGQFLTGAIVMAAAAAFGALCFVGIGLVMLPLFWIFQLYDAYAKPDAALKGEAKRLQQRYPIARTSPPAP